MILTMFLSVSLSQAQNIVWESTYPDFGGETIRDITVLDGDIFAVGYSSFLGNKGRIMRIDSLGNLKWSKDVFFRGLNRSLLNRVEKVIGEPNLYVAGSISQTGVGNYNFISKMDSTGDTLWVVTSNETGFYALVNSMIQLKDKSIVCAGWRITQTGRDAVAWKVDSTGQTLWKKYYTFGSTEAFDIVEMMDGSLIMAGRNNGDNLLLRIDFDGRLIDNVINSNTANVSVSLAELNQKNQVIQTGWATSPVSQFNNYNHFFDSSYFSFQHLGLNTAETAIDLDSNILISYFDGANTKIRYSASRFLSNIWEINMTSSNGNVKTPNGYLINGNGKFIAYGSNRINNNFNYWLAKIDGVGEEWIPDPCAFSPPVAGFAYDFNGGIFTLLDTSYAGLPYLDTIYTWDWTLSDGFTSNLESPVTLLDTTTTKTLEIQLIVSNWYGCKDTINQTLNFGPTGITSDIQFEEKVWPNPVRDVLHISLSEKPGQTVLFEIFDVHGRVQKTMSFEGTEAMLNISSLPQGIYFYKLSAGGVVKRGKVVKE